MQKYDQGLERRSANYTPLSPLGFVTRAEAVFPDAVAVVTDEARLSYGELGEQVRRLADGLRHIGVRRYDTVAALLPNTPPMIAAYFGVAGCGAVLNPINTRLDPQAIAHCLQHGEAKVLLIDREFRESAIAAINLVKDRPIIIDASFPEETNDLAVDYTYEFLLALGDPTRPLNEPKDEWDPIMLSYTSGTTGISKGVVSHHRGAYIGSFSNVAVWGMHKRPVYLWTLPMFHSLGWCFPWTIPLLGGTQVCLRKVDPKRVLSLIQTEGVTHLCGAPTILKMIVETDTPALSHRVNLMTAAAPPPPRILEQIVEKGFDILHTYGLTEASGCITICEPQLSWTGKDPATLANLHARQGLPYPHVHSLNVIDSSGDEVPWDATAIGEVVVRSNSIMKGYLKDTEATEAALSNGYLRTGDLAVRHPDGYIELKDRAKDIIISGGENISTIEIEAALYQHPEILEAAVVACPDKHWGETPCAFVLLKEGAQSTAEDIIEFCKQSMARFKAPRHVIFGPLPRTSTGKVQKYILRDRAKNLASGSICELSPSKAN